MIEEGLMLLTGICCQVAKSRDYGKKTSVGFHMPEGPLRGWTPSVRSESGHGNAVVNLEDFGPGKTACGQFQVLLQEETFSHKARECTWGKWMYVLRIQDNIF